MTPPPYIEAVFHYLINDDLSDLNEKFKSAGFNLWFVGGAVRDVLLGIEPKDVDLCTDASPVEQAKIYTSNLIRHIPTGLHHGTYTVVINDREYEITSLRDSNGNHTTDINVDLAQRDFTINAMAVTFDKVLIDPFGGAHDLKAKVIKFVSDEETVIRNDPLRMMRYFRFKALLEDFSLPDKERFNREQHYLLRKLVKRNRIWTEVKKALQSNHASWIMEAYAKSGIGDIFGLTEHYRPKDNILVDAKTITDDPLLLLIALFQKSSMVYWAGTQLDWSSKELAKAMEVCAFLQGPMSVHMAKVRIATGTPKDWILDAARLLRQDELVESIESWKVPNFPLTREEVNNDELYNRLKMEWAYSGFRISSINLRKRIP